ncbi:hypothetical protein HJP15_16770 [Pseudoalteromonas sp. NEC-BIFX-2020_002]|uniref:hypothetical protein n=1 Tax=Pseudoalteromonas sp. NEC-BIFX-2020_002 TaxID=2732353 RepID=UPI001476B0B4|nr:hypothetical protein [Pseudoalteromonas sp. NEC-BIFX-2020_002]NNG44552.1 hypothetical protein [Pseudoalteromonas sp. NEC-BIFX-2020_002]
MDLIAFILVGIVTGLGSALMLLRFDGAFIKSISLSGGAAVLIGEFLAFAELLGITDENKATMLVSLLSSWIISFLIVLIVLLQSFKKQETKYKIQTWEILLGDKKAIDNYYNSKYEEISKKIEGEYNYQSLKSEKEQIELEKSNLKSEKQHLEILNDSVDDILDKKYKLDIPDNFKFPIKSDFFELLPRYIQSISEFSQHISSFTDAYIKDVKRLNYDQSQNTMLKSYLTGLGFYVGQYLFDWRDVRVHFRRLNSDDNTYEKYVAAFKSGEEYQEMLTPIPADDGLIALAIKTKRSVVYSANRKEAFETGSGHIWKDYITMVFEKLQTEGMPVLSLGVSVKHHADHRDMLYFLSYIQIEQIIQENLLKIDEEFNVRNAALTEAA